MWAGLVKPKLVLYVAKMRRIIGLALTVVFIISQGTPSYAGQNLLPGSDATWLATMNYYRVSSGLKPVTEDPKLSANVAKHMTYVTLSDPKYFTGKYADLHLENPASPYYSAAGAHTAQDISTSSIPNQFESIDMWMAAPSHALGLMREGLYTAGWGSAYSVRTAINYTGIDIFAGLKPGRTKEIMFPGNGSYSRMDSYTGESPDSRQDCGSNWRSYSGLPIWVSLLKSPPTKMSAQLTTPSGNVLKSQSQLCIVDEFNFKSSDRVYGSTGKAIIKAGHMVLLFPKAKLEAGLQNVTLLLGGTRKISWSFTVIAAPAALSWTSTTNPTQINWIAPPATTTNPTVGYDVMVGDSHLKKFQDFSTTLTDFPTASLTPGSYFVCVKVVGTYRDGTCTNFYPLSVS